LKLAENLRGHKRFSLQAEAGFPPRYRNVTNSLFPTAGRTLYCPLARKLLGKHEGQQGIYEQQRKPYGQRINAPG
jgi:hypothetical protein